MELSYIKIIETLILVGIYILIRSVSNSIISRTMRIKLIQKPRGKIIKKAINSTLVLIVWGVNQSDLATYVGSILTVVGVAFFAQWSILYSFPFIRIITSSNFME